MNATEKTSLKNSQGFRDCVIFFLSAICILSFSSASSKGAFNGLKICSNLIIPSLFPFTVLSVFFQKSGGLLWLGNSLNKVSQFLFKLQGIDFSVILLSLIGGYPIGGKIINDLYKSETISKEKAKKLLRFCINPSPAFLVLALGVNIFKNKNIGYIFLASNAIACLILNLLFKGNSKDKTKKPIGAKKEFDCFSDSFVSSVFDGAKITFTICAFVVLFSSILEILKPLFKSPKAYALICPLLEISFGISEIKNSNLTLCFYSFLVAFGGFSTILQVKQIANNIRPSILEIVICRMFHGLLATFISFVLFKIFPQTVMVFSNGVNITHSNTTVFFPSIMLLVFSVLFLMFASSKKETN